MKKLKIAIIGGGFTGLTAAYRLGQKGYEVEVLEKSSQTGGLAGGFEIDGTNLEKAYHHIFRTDTDIINLAKELGLSKKLQWHESSIGLYYEQKMYPFLSPMDLLKFKPLGLIDKVRLGLVKIYLEKDNNWEKYIPIPAYRWMKRTCGDNAYRVIWEPLLKGKFHDHYKEVSMAWLWARIHTRANSKEKGEATEKLGYFNGGFKIVADELEKRIKEAGGKIKTGVNVESINNDKDGKVAVKIDGKKWIFDKVVAAVPSYVFGKMIENGTNAIRPYIKKLNSIDYLGAVIVVFSSKQSLSPYYWHNINDTKSPFLAFLQHTNLIDKKNYGNQEVYYLGTYIPHDHKFFKVEENEVYREFFDYLKKIYPEFDQKLISQKHLFRLKNAQHLVTCDYDQKIPDYKTPMKNVYLSNFSQIFPEDRGTNFAVREGNKIADLAARII